MIQFLRRTRVTLVIREHEVRAWARSSVARALRATRDASGLERALREVLGELRLDMNGSPRVLLRVLLGCHAVRLRRIDGIPRALSRTALADFFREGVSRLLAVRPDAVALSFVREGDAHLVAAYDREELSALYDIAAQLNLSIEIVVPELAELASTLRDGCAETRDGFWLGRIELVDGSIARTSVRRVAAGTPSEPAESLSLPGGVGSASRAQRRRLSALAAQPPRRPGVPVSRKRALVATGAAAAAALLLIVTGPAQALYDRARARHEVATLVAAHAGVLERQQELLALRETITHASRLAVARPSVLRTIGSLAQVLPDEMSLLHLELDSLGGSLVILAPRAGEALARFDRAAGIASPTFSGPITRETSSGRPLDRATIAFRFSDASDAP